VFYFAPRLTLKRPSSHHPTTHRHEKGQHSRTTSQAWLH